jgi:1-acyl-sn-glycerol-3-phosphate acyltransferase
MSGEHQGLSQSAAIRMHTSKVFWKIASPEVIAAIERHNRAVGTRLQRFVQAAIKVYLLGPLFFAAVRGFLRVRVVNGQRLHRLAPERKVIYAPRHFYEWDPFVMLYGCAYSRIVRTPWLDPIAFAGHFWMKSRLRRAVSWCLGLVGVVRKAGLKQSGLERAGDLLGEARPISIAVLPTGPIGRSERYEVKPGLAQVAIAYPDVVIQPVTMVGVQYLRWRSVWRLRRPPVTIAFCEPFRASEIGGRTPEERIRRICGEIARRWTEEEVKLGARPPVEAALPCADRSVEAPAAAAPAAPAAERTPETALR